MARVPVPAIVVHPALAVAADVHFRDSFDLGARLEACVRPRNCGLRPAADGPFLEQQANRTTLRKRSAQATLGEAQHTATQPVWEERLQVYGARKVRRKAGCACRKALSVR